MPPSPPAVWEACLQDLELLADGLLGSAATAAASGRVERRLDTLEQQRQQLSDATWKKLLQDMEVGLPRDQITCNSTALQCRAQTMH